MANKIWQIKPRRFFTQGAKARFQLKVCVAERQIIVKETKMKKKTKRESTAPQIAGARLVEQSESINIYELPDGTFEYHGYTGGLNYLTVQSS